LDKSELAEECESELWKTIYEMHRKGLPYEIINFIISEVIAEDVYVMAVAESALSPAHYAEETS